MTAKDVINEMDLLSSEILDKDSIGKNLNRVIDWFKSNELEEEFLNELPQKLDALLANLEDQVNELDATATGLLKIALKKINEVDVMRDHYKSFEREHWLNGLVQARWKEFKDKLEEKSKKIKKEKREKFFAAAAEKKKKNNNKGKVLSIKFFLGVKFFFKGLEFFWAKNFFF